MLKKQATPLDTIPHVARTIERVRWWGLHISGEANEGSDKVYTSKGFTVLCRIATVFSSWHDAEDVDSGWRIHPVVRMVQRCRQQEYRTVYRCGLRFRPQREDR